MFAGACTGHRRIRKRANHDPRDRLDQYRLNVRSVIGGRFFPPGHVSEDAKHDAIFEFDGYSVTDSQYAAFADDGFFVHHFTSCFTLCFASHVNANPGVKHFVLHTTQNLFGAQHVSATDGTGHPAPHTRHLRGSNGSRS